MHKKEMRKRKKNQNRHFLKSKKECKDDRSCIIEGENGAMRKKLQDNLDKCSLKRCKKEMKNKNKSRKLLFTNTRITDTE